MANRYEQEISKGLKSLGWYTIKVPVASKQGISFLRDAPFDFISICAGVPYSFEAKMNKNDDTSFPFSRLASHQLTNLMAFADAGGKAYVTISFRKPKLCAYAITIGDWTDMMRELATIHKRKSIPRAWFTSDPRIMALPRVRVNGDLIWDFNVIRTDIDQSNPIHIPEIIPEKKKKKPATLKKSVVKLNISDLI